MCAAAAGFTEAVRDGLATLAYRRNRPYKVR